MFKDAKDYDRSLTGLTISTCDPKIKSDMAKKRWQDPEFRNKQLKHLKKRMQDPEMRKKISISLKKTCQDPEYRKKLSKRQQKLWQDPELRKQMSNTVKKVWQDPEYRNKQSKSQQKLWQDPEYRKQVANTAKKNWQDPEIRKKYKKARSTSRQALEAKKRESMVKPYYLDYLRGNKSYHDISNATGLSYDSIGFFIRRFNKQNGYKVITKNRDNKSVDRFVYDITTGNLLDI